MIRFRGWLKRIFVLITVLFLLPSMASAAWWAVQERPQGWRSASWRSSGLLPATPPRNEASILVLAARTGGMKGALALHSWIVIKKPGAETYDRYDKVGWGTPVRRNAYDADGLWYSNRPFVVGSVTGEEARRLIPEVEAAIAAYPHSRPTQQNCAKTPPFAFVLRRIPLVSGHE